MITFTISRIPSNPIIYPDLDPSIGSNINGPSLIRVPEWIPNPLGAYYLYFAAHNGTYIRLAYADSIEGPYTIYAPGSLSLKDSLFKNHIASPDVHVDHENQQIRMYYHGVITQEEQKEHPTPSFLPDYGMQQTRVALSKDGIHFDEQPQLLGLPYFRAFNKDNYWYGLGMPGVLYRSKDGIHSFESGKHLFTKDMRHSAVLLKNNAIYVFFSNAGDTPEHILCAKIPTEKDWHHWLVTDTISVLKPEWDYEGADVPIETSKRGLAQERVHQLRDPAVFLEHHSMYLLYSIAGEYGIAMANLALE